MRRLLFAGAAGLWLLLASTAAAQGPIPPPGPPYPPPVENQVVYDYANIFESATESAATQTIVAIEQRTAAEIAVYTQVKPWASTESTVQDANDLIDQWGIGRLGFDDGMVILFNMDESLCHGQVQLYAGPGFQATFLSNDERQHIYENDMRPFLRDCDLDGALLVAMSKIDAAATPEHAARLQLARQIDAAVGLVGAPAAFLLLVGWAGRAWWRYGKDPIYLDDPSILLPAPPAGLTAAAGSVVWEGQATRTALNTGLLDLASRGEFSFSPEPHLLARDKVGIELLAQPPDDPYVVRNRRRPLGPAENMLLARLRGLRHRPDSAPISSTELQKLAPSVGLYNSRLEEHVAASGWFREPPRKAIARWTVVAWGAFIVGLILVVWLAGLIPMGSLMFVGGALMAGGVVTGFIARYMPARTMSGAMVYAMLAAYRRTLQKTMQQARSMQTVVQEANLAWLETPDQAVVWGVALGLHDEVERVLERTAQDVERGITYNVWMPGWYGGGFSHGQSWGAAGGGGIAPGLFSSGAIPNFGGMMAALGTIGVAPSSSGSGGSGGFSGGGGGGGGGGAGGGF